LPLGTDEPGHKKKQHSLRPLQNLRRLKRKREVVVD